MSTMIIEEPPVKTEPSEKSDKILVATITTETYDYQS